MNEGTNNNSKLERLVQYISNNINKILVQVAAVAVIVLIFVILFYIINFHEGFSIKQEDWGTFGDYVGGLLNPILSFFALLALLITIVFQSRELKLSREELELTREELKRSSDALEKQSETLKIQNFENTFFHMIDLHHNIVNGIDLISADGKTTTGRDCFKIFYNRFKRKYRDLSDTQRISQSGPIEVAYEEFLSSTQSDVSHYFSNL